ncbi:MAG: hypothetical protein WCP28_09150 [Actinomycetes bacterium]
MTEQSAGTLEKTVVPEASPLTAQDRCDRCVAAAAVRTVFIHSDGSRELLFCGHHFNEHEDKLVAAGAMINDYRVASV